MVTDMTASIEVRVDGVWRLEQYDVSRICNYDVFGCVFGVRNYAGFTPLAASRGLPSDLSAELRRLALEWEDDAHDCTWISAAEFEAVDWDEYAAVPDQRVHRYELGRNGEVYVGKEFRAIPPSAPPMTAKGTRWRRGYTVWRVERMRRRDVLMELADHLARLGALSSQHGSDDVRWVVWFDS